MRSTLRAISTRFTLVTIVAVVGLAGAVPSHAATIAVDAFGDDHDLGANGNCTLREAVIAANEDRVVDACPAGAGADLIELGPGTYTLAIAGADENGSLTGDLDVFGDVVIRGAGAGATTIDAGQLDRAFDIGSASARLERLTIRRGKIGTCPFTGAGIRHAAGDLTLSEVIVEDSGNWWSSGCDGVGGGLYVSPGATTHLVSSTLRENQATNGGGAFVEQTGTLELVRSAIFDNTTHKRGGGIEVRGTLDATNSTIGSNSSFWYWHPTSIYRYPGGLVAYGTGHVTLDHVTITGNSEGDLYADVGSTIELRATIIGFKCSGDLTGVQSLGYNLVGYQTCNLDQPTDLQNTPALLGEAVFGDLPPFYEPLAGSPPVDAAGTDGCPATDQRGVARPQGTACDIGAVEYAPPVCTDGDGDGWYAEGGACGVADCSDADAQIHPGAAERCNALDDDCDGDADEAFADLGAACTAGVGACAATGTTVCGADGLGTACDAIAGEPGIEGPFGDPSCGNTSDDDCDGTADEADADCVLHCTDGDGDGFGVEGGECGSVDCDDANPAVNPGRAEVPGNGLDDDCNPATPPQSGCAPQPQSANAALGTERAPAGFPLALGPWIGALALAIRGVRRRTTPAGRTTRAG